MKTANIPQVGEFQIESSRKRKALDYLGLAAVIMVGVFGWSLPLLSGLPAFNLFLFTMVGTRMATVGVPDSPNRWEDMTKKATTGAFYAVLAGAALATFLAVTGLAAGAAAALPALFTTVASLGLIYTGASFIRQMRDYYNTPASLRDDMMKHKMLTTTLSFGFQLMLTAAIISAMVVPGLIIPGAQPFLLIAIPFAIIGMAAYKFMYERQESKRILGEGNTKLVSSMGYAPKPSKQTGHTAIISSKPVINVARNEEAVVASAVAPGKAEVERRDTSLASNPNAMFANQPKEVVVEENLKTRKPGYDVNNQSEREQAKLRAL